MKFYYNEDRNFKDMTKGPVCQVADGWDPRAVEKPISERRIRLMFGLGSIEGTLEEFVQAFESFDEVQREIEEAKIEWQKKRNSTGM